MHTKSHHAFIEALSPYWLQFERSSHSPSICQQMIGLEIIKNNIASTFGKKYHFKDIHNIEEYRQAVPIQSYLSLHPYIEAIADKDKHSLTHQYPITHFELTSGSTSKVKMIPYTKELCQQFFCGIAPWLYNLYSNKPELSHGKFFWVISPPKKSKSMLVSNTRIGESDDCIYFPESIQSLLSAHSALSFQKIETDSSEDFMAQQIAELLCCEKLRWISLWNPSYMQSLFSNLLDKPSSVFDRVDDIDVRRRLSSLWEQCQAQQDRFFSRTWKHLDFISCWSDGSAQQLIPRLEELFPNATIQGKGLMATEGIVSFPLLGNPGHVLAINSHFLEFICIASNDVLLAHELEIGKHYEVVLTTAGGLYRYRLNDVIEVIGLYHQTPLIKFIGRNRVIDLVGEKLHEHTLSTILLKSTKTITEKKFLLLAPEQEQNTFFYHLYIVANINSSEQSHLANEIERQLQHHFHYAHARRMHQLQPVRVSKLSSAQRAHSIVQSFYHKSRKIPLSMLKNSYVDPEHGWNQRFSEVLAS